VGGVGHEFERNFLTKDVTNRSEIIVVFFSLLYLVGNTMFEIIISLNRTSLPVSNKQLIYLIGKNFCGLNQIREIKFPRKFKSSKSANFFAGCKINSHDFFLFAIIFVYFLLLFFLSY